VEKEESPFFKLIDPEVAKLLFKIKLYKIEIREYTPRGRCALNVKK